MTITEVLERIAIFRKASRAALARVETSPTRLITVEESYNRITGLSIKQDDLFRQALRCVENELFRAAHVMAWAAFMDFLHEKLAEDGLVKLHKARPHWKLTASEDLREQSDFHLIEAAKDVGLLGRTVQKALQGLLNRRNECAHPEDFYPGLNESLGYLSELIKRIETLKSRTL